MKMKYRMEFRYNDFVKDKVEFILANDPDLESISHLIRCAIIKFHTEVKNNVNKRITPYSN